MAAEQEIRQVQTDQQFSSTIDWKRIGFLALRYWYFVLFTLTVCISIAFYKIRYSQRIYPVMASIIIREKEETSGAELLYKNAIIDQYRNYLNEPYILRSCPLIQRVVEDLNFDVSFYQAGYILTTEAYDAFPIEARLIRGESLSHPAKYVFKILNDASYSLQLPDQPATVPAHKFNFGDEIVFDNNKLIIQRNEGMSLKELENDPYLLTIQNPFNVAAEYVAKLDITWAEEGSGVIYVKVNGPVPNKEIDFINGLVKTYQQYDLNKKNQTANRTVAFIKSQLNKISDSLKIFENQLQQFKKENRTSGNMDYEAQQAFSKITALAGQRAEIVGKEKYYEYLKKYMTESKNLEQVILPSSFGINDPVISNLVGKIADVQLELKLFIDQEKIRSPLVTNKLVRLAELKREVGESMQSLRSTDKIKLALLDNQIAEAEQKISHLPFAERQLVTIRRSYTLLENLYVFLMQKMSEAEISKASSASDIFIVNPPLLMGGAIYPKVGQNYAIASIFGLGIPLAIFILLELLNTKIQSKEDIDKLTTIPFIGGIGHKKSASNMEVLNSPKSAIAESFRALRSNLNYFIDQKDKPVFLITSSISGEGKTFTSLNLASIFALSGKRTLIVGADMRKPKIYQDFQLHNEKGLSTYLSGIDTFELVIQKTSNAMLDLVSGGPVPPNPSELLLNVRMETFMGRAKSDYDIIVIDTPPMAIVTDAFALSKFADHTLFIIRQNYTPKSLIKTTEDFYSSGKLSKMSIVLNDIYRSGLGYGYGYGYGYDYYGYGKKKNGYGYYTEG